MDGFVFYAGPVFADILWALTVLPPLRAALPRARLTWECPLPACREWLALYPELDGIVGDVEDAPIPPDVYLILHPLWLDQGREAVSGLFAAVGKWCPRPDPPPIMPYCPPLPEEPSLPNDLPDLPADYICLDPVLAAGRGIQSTVLPYLDELAAGLNLPVVQVGAKDVPPVPNAIDARDTGIVGLAHLLRRSRAVIGGDGAVSCLAGALRVPQVWVRLESGSWWWPYGDPSLCDVYTIDAPAAMDTPVLLDLLRPKLGRPGVES